MPENQFEEPSMAYQIGLTVYIMAIGFSCALFTMYAVGHFGFSADKDFIGIMWRIMSLDFLLLAVPLAFGIEFMFSRWKKRSFRWLSILWVVVMLGEAIVVLVGAGFAFETLFPNLSFTNEPFDGMMGLILGLLVGFPCLAVGLTSRTDIGKRMRKAFD